VLSHCNPPAVYGFSISDKEERVLGFRGWYLAVLGAIFNLQFPSNLISQSCAVNNQERIFLPSSEVEAHFLAGYINSQSAYQTPAYPPFLICIFTCFTVMADGRCFRAQCLVARLVTIKNALVRCAQERVFNDEMRYHTEKEKERNEGETKRRKERGLGEARQTARRKGRGGGGYNLIRLPFGLIFE